jgi:hypothetical protein
VSGAPSRSDTVTLTPHEGRLGLRVAAAAALPAEADLRTWFADVARLGRESSGRCADVCNGSPLARDPLLRLAARFSDWRPASPFRPRRYRQSLVVSLVVKALLHLGLKPHRGESQASEQGVCSGGGGI